MTELQTFYADSILAQMCVLALMVEGVIVTAWVIDRLRHGR